MTQDTNHGNLVSTVNRVARQYVGITLNLRPRVFAEDLLEVPEISARRLTGQARVKNHTPIRGEVALGEREESS